MTIKQTSTLLLKIALAMLLFIGLPYLIYRGYGQTWSGFQGYVNSKGEYVPPKKLWDWLQLLIVPLALSFGVWWLNRSQKISDQKVETDRQRQKALEDYFDGMTKLLLENSLRAGNAEAKSIARTRTLSVFNILDADRKGQALQFLFEARLIDKGPVVNLRGADLSGARLNGATLRNVELRGVWLNGAELAGANLCESDLRGSNLTNANLEGALLQQSDLRQTILTGAKTKNADLSEAIFDEAILPKELQK